MKEGRKGKEEQVGMKADYDGRQFIRSVSLLQYTHVNIGSFQADRLSSSRSIRWKKSKELDVISIPLDRIESLAIQVKETGEK